ncbi:MAG: hypothetical protein RLZ18_756 [Actinomycetota bacterium]|jgi:hypothetical protein
MHTQDMNGDDEWRFPLQRIASRSPWCRHVGIRGNARKIRIGDFFLPCVDFLQNVEVITPNALWNANDLTWLEVCAIEANEFSHQVGNSASWRNAASDAPNGVARLNNHCARHYLVGFSRI